MKKEFKKVVLFKNQKSRGTFDDFYDIKKYNTMEEAYKNNDYVECDFVKDENEILYIELKNIKKPENIKYYKLIYQYPIFGIDISDDDAAYEIATTLF